MFKNALSVSTLKKNFQLNLFPSPVISENVYSNLQGSIYWKIPPPRGGGNKYGLMGKKYHENNARANKKGEKRKKGQGKRKDK